MSEEREIMRGFLNKNSGYRLIVSGPFGMRELERLIEKLEIDKDILEEAEGYPSAGIEVLPLGEQT